MRVEMDKGKSITDIHLEHLNPQLWKELSGLSVEDRDKRWFQLTQKHLTDYKNGKVTEDGFFSEELEFLFLNRLGSVSFPVLDVGMPLRGFFINTKGQPDKKSEKLNTFGKCMSIIQHEIENYIGQEREPFQILVGGIGISGKATIRNVLSRELSERLTNQKILSWDRDYQKIFPIPSEWQGSVHIIEDVHGLDEKRDKNSKLERFDGNDGLLHGYDMVVYVLPTKNTYKQNLVRRGMGWLRAGKINLTDPEGKQYVFNREEKIQQTAEECERILLEAQKWFREQLRVLRELKKRGIKIVVVEPSEILNKCYSLKDNPELFDKSFLETLTLFMEERDDNI